MFSRSANPYGLTTEMLRLSFDGAFKKMDYGLGLFDENEKNGTGMRSTKHALYNKAISASGVFIIGPHSET